MTGVLAWNSKVATCFAPFPPMRENPSPRSGMCQQMRKFVTQSAIDFGGAKFLQRRIKQNEEALEIRTTDGGAHAIVPVHPQTCRQTFCLERAQQGGGALL
jgi:hypothetical protein